MGAGRLACARHRQRTMTGSIRWRSRYQLGVCLIHGRSPKGDSEIHLRMARGLKATCRQSCRCYRVQMPLAGHAFELADGSILELYARSRHQISNRTRDHYLVRARHRCYPGTGVHGDPNQFSRLLATQPAAALVGDDRRPSPGCIRSRWPSLSAWRHPSMSFPRSAHRRPSL